MRTYFYEENPILKNEICIYYILNDVEFLVASINKANFDTDEDALNEAKYICEKMNN